MANTCGTPCYITSQLPKKIRPAFLGSITKLLRLPCRAAVRPLTTGAQSYDHTYDAAGRMSALSVNGTPAVEYRYNFQGQQVRRQLLTTGQIIHSLHDLGGKRIAEFLYDPLTATSTELREYIWADGRLVAVSEGGVLYFVRTDHIGRPAFATNAAGTMVWSASYLPFGGIAVSTGAALDLRFPGQWFQSEAGLFQNWMRDYDPTTGRYNQADPLGLVDGASVYGYALQNPLRWTDPSGQQSLADILRRVLGDSNNSQMVPNLNEDIYFPEDGGTMLYRAITQSELTAMKAMRMTFVLGPGNEVKYLTFSFPEAPRFSASMPAADGTYYTIVSTIYPERIGPEFTDPPFPVARFASLP